MRYSKKQKATLIETLLRQLEDGLTPEEAMGPLSTTCQSLGCDLPKWSTFLHWFAQDEATLKRYHTARQITLDLLLDSTIEISRRAGRYNTPACKLQVDTIFKLAQIRYPELYGEKREVTLKGDKSAPLIVKIDSSDAGLLGL